MSGVEVLCHLRPADEVGGDYLDLYESDEASWVMVGDVTGHGLGAGIVMLMAQSTISSLLAARPGLQPCELAYLVNRIMAANLTRMDERRSLSLVAVQHRHGSDELVISGCHDDLFIWRAESGTLENVPVAHLPFGVGIDGDLRQKDVRQDRLLLRPGDLLYAGTDGVTEAPRRGDYDNGMFGEDGLREVLTQCGNEPLEELRHTLVTRLEEYTAGRYADDIAFALLRRLE
jgi:sigma-B regulation protein RsbU (phosphoserine phosphatase)